ncbi:hypothetical protein R3W88_029196 [Solanum pinnatisectum]|uniref:Uncharacterized protein n=1 Tax=Solanum pinnatisectum TaxID=50273 RepID=A0AAV9K4K7_9SOLN|nr:hypothetical protein R3W88_029196 [Solanum pinnatisectum]
MAKDPSYVKFFGFLLVLQIWFYECCNKVDASTVIHTCHLLPASSIGTFQKTRFISSILRKACSENMAIGYYFYVYTYNYYCHMFQDVVFMDDERVVIELENLNDLNDSSFNKLRKLGNIRQSNSDTRKNEKELSYNFSHYVGVDSSLTSNEDF